MQGAIPILKLNRLDTHDRYQSVTKQGFDIDECCAELASSFFLQAPNNSSEFKEARIIILLIIIENITLNLFLFCLIYF
jgi:hypothetical protein